jgi:hypothetical protein
VEGAQSRLFAGGRAAETEGAGRLQHRQGHASAGDRVRAAPRMGCPSGSDEGARALIVGERHSWYAHSRH